MEPDALTRYRIEDQCNRVDAVLVARGIKARVTGGHLSEHLVTLTVARALSVHLPTMTRCAPDLAAILQAPAVWVRRDGRQGVTLTYRPWWLVEASHRTKVLLEK